jgi:hypothetical protein
MIEIALIRSREAEKNTFKIKKYSDYLMEFVYPLLAYLQAERGFFYTDAG